MNKKIQNKGGKKMETKIYCYASGQVMYADTIPEGALPILKVDSREIAHDLMVRFCSLSRTDSKTYSYAPIAHEGLDALYDLEKKMEAQLAEWKKKAS